MDGLDDAIAAVLRVVFGVEQEHTQADYVLCI
jgi:hypothetical protein